MEKAGKKEQSPTKAIKPIIRRMRAKKKRNKSG